MTRSTMIIHAMHVLGPAYVCFRVSWSCVPWGRAAGGGGGNLCVQFFTLYSPTIKKFGKNHTWCAKHVLGLVYAVSTVFRHCMAWRGFTGGGGGG